MNDGGGHHAAPARSIDRADVAPPRWAGSARPIGWIAAGRLAAGKSAVRGGEELQAVLAAAAIVPALEDVEVATAGELTEVLAAFRRAGDSAERATRDTARPRAARLTIVKCAAALFIVAGGGLAAASAGVLPDPVQRFAHDYLGGVGVPAPSASAAMATPSASGSPSPNTSALPSKVAKPATSATATSLCRTVTNDPQNWRTELSQADRAALIAAAGGSQEVTSYCAVVVATPSQDGNAGNGGDGGSGGNGDQKGDDHSASADPGGGAPTAANGGQPTAPRGDPHPGRSASPGAQAAKPSASPAAHH